VRFFAENAEEALWPHFSAVERRDVTGEMTFTRDEALAYLAASIGHRDLADRLPAFDEPLVVTRHMTIFIASA
jgi:hypothetical protein